MWANYGLAGVIAALVSNLIRTVIRSQGIRRNVRIPERNSCELKIRIWVGGRLSRFYFRKTESVFLPTYARLCL
jgi:hypothetical protein